MNRGAFLAASATLASTARAASQAIPGGAHLVERHSDFDEEKFASAVGRPAAIRQLYEAVAFHPGILNNIKNSFNGLQFGFGYPADRIAIVLGAHGPSAAFGYSDAVWQRYRLGEFFKLSDADGTPVRSNVFLQAHASFNPSGSADDESGMYQDRSLQMLQRRGLILLTCHTAVEEQAQALFQRDFAPSGMTREQIAADILTHLIPGAVVVPAMVAAIAVLQATYRYTYLAPQL
ncbi:MAG: hypothetical protein JO263_04055 [Candidatus Eremiobacteraeota bacterium]|nr:hypothetical protein [Candidatus Eremiobacteraeota bacterium]